MVLILRKCEFIIDYCKPHLDEIFFHASTDAVFPHGLRDCAEDADMTPHAENLTDGYSQSKWVAEQLVLKAMERGLPAAVYRPGTSKDRTVTNTF